jgi:hypothetical protein
MSAVYYFFARSVQRSVCMNFLSSVLTIHRHIYSTYLVLGKRGSTLNVSRQLNITKSIQILSFVPPWRQQALLLGGTRKHWVPPLPPQPKLWQTGFEVLKAASMKMAVFWVVSPCSLVKVYRRFRCPCCLHHLGDDWLRRVVSGSCRITRDSRTTVLERLFSTHLRHMWDSYTDLLFRDFALMMEAATTSETLVDMVV